MVSVNAAPRAARLSGLSGPGSRRGPLTKPVFAAARRPTPRWIGWVVISLPTLSVAGLWLPEPAVTLYLLALVLGLAALWDWARFQDRSRSLRAGYLGAILLVIGAVNLVWRQPAVGPAVAELLNIACAAVLALAFVQLYRSEESVLTVVRGWLYLLVLLSAATLVQRVLYGPHPMSGPFSAPAELAVAALTGLTLMPLGCALEHDRRLVWAYPVAAACALEVLWWSQQAVALGLGLGLAALWAVLGRRTRWAFLGALTAIGLALALGHGLVPFRWEDTGPSWGERRFVALHALEDLAGTWFLGLGPAGEAVPCYNPLVELAAEYGLGAAVVTASAGLGVLYWCVHRLARTRGLAWISPERSAALWCGLMVAGVPVVGALQPAWLGQPSTVLIIATVAVLARHVEDPQGRRAVSGVGSRRRGL
jgi:hypothetical protein